MKKKVIRCVEAKTLTELKKYKHGCIGGSSYVYYGFDGCKDDSKEHVQALKEIVEKELRKVEYGAPTTIPMTVCKIKPQQSQTHAHMTMIKVLVPNSDISVRFGRRHIEL